MRQFLADQIDQLDLALDQLAMRDRNFDRFALMLIDNVVELTLHQHAQDRNVEAEASRHSGKSYEHQKALTEALAGHFDAKVKLARATGMVPEKAAESIRNLHTFRNTAYHRGLRHERILHSLALFYVRNACSFILLSYKPLSWRYGGDDKISHRAVKYLGSDAAGDREASFKAAWKRLLDVAGLMGNQLIADLSADMEATVDGVDTQIAFLNDYDKKGRDAVVLDCQVYSIAFSDQTKEWAATNGYNEGTTKGSYIEWLKSHHPWPFKKDPIPSWRRRLISLKEEKDEQLALTKYCDFMRETEPLREQIDQTDASLESFIELQREEMEEEAAEQIMMRTEEFREATSRKDSK